MRIVAPALVACAIGWATPALVQGDPAPDPACPQGDLAFPRAPDSTCIGELTEGYAFSVVYPRGVSRIPALEALVRDEAQARLRQLREQTEAWRAERLAADPDGEPAIRLSYEQGWNLDADLPALAALSSPWMTYTGGAHEGIGYEVILFDRAASRRLGLAELFEEGGLATLQPVFCSALRAQVRERRDGDDSGVECPSAAEQPVALCATAGRITMMTALLNPYVVGSFAEGPYEVSFPVTAEMAAALKPAYRSSFAPAEAPPAPDASCRS